MNTYRMFFFSGALKYTSLNVTKEEWSGVYLHTNIRECRVAELVYVFFRMCMCEFFFEIFFFFGGGVRVEISLILSENVQHC